MSSLMICIVVYCSTVHCEREEYNVNLMIIVFPAVFFLSSSFVKFSKTKSESSQGKRNIVLLTVLVHFWFYTLSFINI